MTSISDVRPGDDFRLEDALGVTIGEGIADSVIHGDGAISAIIDARGERHWLSPNATVDHEAGITPVVIRV